MSPDANPARADVEIPDLIFRHTNKNATAMDIERLHPELQKPYSKIPPIPLHNPVFYFLISTVMKLVPNKIKPVPGVIIEDRKISNCSVRIYRPAAQASGAAALWMHGGGYIMGNTGLNDKECSALASELKLTVVSVDYRLAPKHPFPAALDDCLDAWNFMLSSAEELKIDPNRLAIIGQSAGGGLAASLVHRIADAGGTQPAAQVLWYPMLDDRTAANTSLDAINHKFFTNKTNRGAWRWYLNQEPGLDNTPKYSVPARREDLSGLPPAWLCVGELDLFYEEDNAYAKRLQNAGVRCDLYITPKAPHAFDAVAAQTSVSTETVNDSYRFLREVLTLQ